MASTGGSGYGQPNPPEDDCCPICFGSYSIPCRTNCGHWYCASCILSYAQYGKARWCPCPICCSTITKLYPHSSSPIEQGEDRGKILKEVKQYNRDYKLQWLSLLWTFLQYEFSLMRRRFQETFDSTVLKPAFEVMRGIGPLLLLAYLSCGFKVPFGIYGLVLWTQFWVYVVHLIFTLDAVWYRWTRERARRQAEAEQE